MNAASKNGIAEHKDRSRAAEIDEVFDCLALGERTQFAAPVCALRPPAGVGLRPEIGGLCGYRNSLAVVPPTQFDRVAHPRGAASRCPAESEPTVCKTAAPLDDVDGRDIARSEERPSFDGLCTAMMWGAADVTSPISTWRFRSGSASARGVGGPDRQHSADVPHAAVQVIVEIGIHHRLRGFVGEDFHLLDQFARESQPARSGEAFGVLIETPPSNRILLSIARTPRADHPTVVI